MNSVPFILIFIFLVLIAGPILLWFHLVKRSKQKENIEFVERQLERLNTNVRIVKDDDTQPLIANRKHVPGFTNLLLRAGVSAEWRFFIIVIFIGFILAIGALLFNGVEITAQNILLADILPAIVTFLFYGVLAYFYLWLKASRRTRLLVNQLPSFLDSLVRLVTIGTSTSSAFQEAAPRADQPLKEVMERVAQLTRAGVDLDVAMRQIARLYRIDELFLLAAVMGIANRFGGRIDQVLERMALFMRDLQQMREELVALSSETRFSAWILALLPVGIACFMFIFNNAMFVNMWHDPTGKKMLIGAVVLQIVGSFWLYRLAKSI